MITTSQFQLNGKSVSLANADPEESLLRWLKRARLTGTKEGCADGDCGACTVALLVRDAQGLGQFQAVNSCLLPVGLIAGREVFTVEALADGATLHPVQQAMLDCAGSQCGYCTPGFVMSLFTGYYSAEPDAHGIEGNLCRCTGYLPIRAAAASLEQDVRAADRFTNLLALACPAPPASELGNFFAPTSMAEAIALKVAQPESAWICGATDLGVQLSHGLNVAPSFIALDRIAELQTLDCTADAVRIGAAVPLSRVERELTGIFPMLDDMLPWFAARQVRNRATLGGNLGSASPIGDLLPILLSLDAVVHCIGPYGSRDVPISAFFLGYRKTALHEHELIAAVTLPRRAGMISGSYKVAKRQTDDISIVAASFALEIDEQQRVSFARLSYGGVAATPIRAQRTEQLLLGQRLNDETLQCALAMLRAEFTPLSDHRAGADYRRALAANLFSKFVAERCS